MKNNQNVIILIKDDIVEVWGRITEIAEAHSDFSYSTLKSKKFPFNYKGWRFYKVRYKTESTKL